MGCSYPVKIENKNYNPNILRSWSRRKYFYVPCGKCLGCQISKRTWLSTAANWEYNYYGVGSFTTLTYDDEHLLHLYDEETGLFLGDYRDFQLFIKRLREGLYKKYGYRHEFKYIAVGEYGGENGRFHIHVLFFGLDYKYNDLDIWNAWGNGIADNRPIKTGGINYVLKYMDKSEIRFKNDVTLYDLKEYQRPFMKHSINLGKGFIEKNIKDIIKHNGTYDKGDGKRHSLPTYWLNKLLIKPIVDYSEVRKEIQRERNHGNDDNWETISKTECINYLMQRSKHDEIELIKKSRQEGKPQLDYDEFYFESIIKEIL